MAINSRPLTHVVCERCGRVTLKRRDKRYRFCSLKCSQQSHADKRTAHRLDVFWSRVNKASGGDCWLWTASQGTFGYGVFSVGNVRKYAHRLSYALAHGPIPAGLSVLHRCDVPLCVNPGHLFLGTQGDNVRDVISKGRLDMAANAQKTRIVRLSKPNCKFGHPFDRVSPHGKRYCSTCIRLNSSRWRRAHAAV